MLIGGTRGRAFRCSGRSHAAHGEDPGSRDRIKPLDSGHTAKNTRDSQIQQGPGVRSPPPVPRPEGGGTVFQLSMASLYKDISPVCPVLPVVCTGVSLSPRCDGWSHAAHGGDPESRDRIKPLDSGHTRRVFRNDGAERCAIAPCGPHSSTEDMEKMIRLTTGDTGHTGEELSVVPGGAMQRMAETRDPEIESSRWIPDTRRRTPGTHKFNRGPVFDPRPLSPARRAGGPFFCFRWQACTRIFPPCSPCSPWLSEVFSLCPLWLKKPARDYSHSTPSSAGAARPSMFSRMKRAMTAGWLRSSWGRAQSPGAGPSLATAMTCSSSG